MLTGFIFGDVAESISSLAIDTVGQYLIGGVFWRLQHFLNDQQCRQSVPWIMASVNSLSIDRQRNLLSISLTAAAVRLSSAPQPGQNPYASRLHHSDVRGHFALPPIAGPRVVSVKDRPGDRGSSNWRHAARRVPVETMVYADRCKPRKKQAPAFLAPDVSRWSIRGTGRLRVEEPKNALLPSPQTEAPAPSGLC